MRRAKRVWHVSSVQLTVRSKRRGGIPSAEALHGEIVAAMGEEVWNWSSPAGRVRLASRVERFVRSLDLASGGKRILEPGCGTGLYTEQLAPYCRGLLAVDVSDVLLDRARSRVRDERVQFVCQDLERLALPRREGPFDGACGNSVLHHLDLEEALPRLRQILTPGADVAFSEPNLLNPQVRLMFSGWRWARRKWSVSTTEMAFYPRELRAAFSAAGFQVIELVPFDFMHPATPAAMIPLVRALGGCLERIPVVRLIAGSLFIHARVPITPT